MQLNNLIPALLLAIVSLVVVPGSAVAAQVYVTDQGHTEVLFGWSHSGVSRQHAEFTVTKGTLKLADDIEKSSIEVNIDASSVSTGFEALDKHLKSKDFLEVETYPEIIFKSTSIKKTGEKTFDVTGNLTMHGVTKPVVLKAEMTHRGKHPVAAFIDYYKGDWIAFRATTEIDHMAFKVGSFSTGPIAIEINTEMKAR
jgi:polyisoprenoid-binding protein YceI